MIFNQKILICSCILLITLCCGCAAQQPQQKPQPNNTDVQVKVDPRLAQQVNNISKGVDGVEDSTAVVVNKEISAAVKVSGFDRLHLKTIRQQVHQKTGTKYQDYTVYVTSDKKLFKLLQDIEKQLNAGKKVSLPQLKQKVDKINEDMRG